VSFFTARNLRVHLGNFALTDVSLELARGEYLSVVGPSGVGKSVLLGAICGFHQIDGGELLIDGRDMTDESPENRGIGIVYQDYALFPHLSVFHNIAYGLQHRIPEEAVRRERVEEMAEVFGVGSMLSRKPGELSGGEQQRTALARALVIRPRLLLMDEPFSSLDPPRSRELRRVVRRWVREFGSTVIHVAHDLDDMWSLPDRVLVMREGKRRAFGRVNEILNPPAPSFLGRVEGVRLVFGTVTERREGVTLVDADGVQLATSDPAAPGEDVRLILRPEDVTVYTERPTGVSARNVLESRVAQIHRIDGAALVRLHTGEVQFHAFLTHNALKGLSLTEGDRVFATIKAVHVRMG
jgi:molybdate transport system ATP-binding protein